MDEFVHLQTQPPLPLAPPNSLSQPPLDATVLYLPTYRRIEHDINTVLSRFDDRTPSDRPRTALRERRNHDPAFVELVEFGMTDVENAIAAIRADLDQFAREHLNNLTFGYLDDIIAQKDKSIDLTPILAAPPNTIESILARLQEPILSPSNKERLSTIISDVQAGNIPNVRTKQICYYFTKLMTFHRDLEARESKLTRFCDACNRYLTDKRLRYSSSESAFTITPSDSDGTSRTIELKDLSSGEKQIVSIFCQLYLSERANYFVVIDEPELSLSVPWQRKFLVDIRNGAFCSGLVAATHSPFIYENSLSKYARALGEFSQ